MNIFKKIILFGFILNFTIGCGTDGEDGEVFLRIRAVLDEMPASVDLTEIPGFDFEDPAEFAYDMFYKTVPGSYPFSYYDHNGEYHPKVGEYGFVDIVKDLGQKGGVFRDGEDGDDVYIDLWLLSTGPAIENNKFFTVASTANFPD